MWQDTLAWLQSHQWLVGGMGGFLLAMVSPWAGAAVKIFEERRAKRAEWRKAANDLLHAADDFRRYWSKRHYEYMNQQPHPDNEPDWSPGPFNPLVLEPSIRAIYSRLSPQLQAQAFQLDQLVKDTASSVSGMIEFVPEELEDEGPMFDAEIAIAAEEVFIAAATEAGMTESYGRESIDSIRSWSEKRRHRRAEAIERHKEVTP
jgi:hypothetical protein